MVEDVLVEITNKYFAGGWRIAPFIKTPDGYIGVKAWPKRAATNQAELQALIEERLAKSSRKVLFGVVPPKGRFIVDIDLKKNTSALQIWRNKVTEHFGDIALASPNLIVKTKSGGFHLYYTEGSDRQIHSPTAVFGRDSGVDIRGYTGMVIMPTSIGDELDWQPGEYTLIRGDPSKPCSVLDLAKIIGNNTTSAIDSFVKATLHRLNEALRNDSVPEHYRYRLIPDDFIIPESNRDNTLFRAAKLCRMAGLSQEAAHTFMQYVANRCEATLDEPVEHWINLAADKVRRVYADEAEIEFKSVNQFFEELDNAGTVMLRGVSKSYYYFRLGSRSLRIHPRSKFATDNLVNVLMGHTINTDEGPVAVKKVVGAYNPRDVAYNAAMYPKTDMPFFEYEGVSYVNTYHDPYAVFEPDEQYLERAKPFIDVYKDYVLHITGGDLDDASYLMQKLAWIVQKPYRRLPTATIIYSHTRGSGKDIFMSLLRDVIGRRYFMPISIEVLDSEFHSFHDKLVCVASEVQQQTNAKGTMAASTFMGKIKNLITTKTISVNEKFQQPYNAPIFTNFFLLSNFELSSMIEPGDRRFDVFHTVEEKLNQTKFGMLADTTNDGIWLDRAADDQKLRDHITYNIRSYLQNIELDPLFDRQEARENLVKSELMAHQAPPAMMWLYENLPSYFTEEIVMMAAHFCPVKLTPEYALKHLKEFYAADVRAILKDGKSIFRLAGSPVLQKKDDVSGRSMPVLVFPHTSISQARRPVHVFLSRTSSAPPSEAWIRADLKRWYDSMVNLYYGNLTKLPGQKPDGLANL